MKNFHILDCTLYDWAYIVDGNFADNAVNAIIANLEKSYIAMIDYGRYDLEYLSDYDGTSIDTTYSYSDLELIQLAEKTNEVMPESLSIVDTLEEVYVNYQNKRIADKENFNSLKSLFAIKIFCWLLPENLCGTSRINI